MDISSENVGCNNLQSKKRAFGISFYSSISCPPMVSRFEDGLRLRTVRMIISSKPRQSFWLLYKSAMHSSEGSLIADLLSYIDDAPALWTLVDGLSSSLKPLVLRRGYEMSRLCASLPS